MYQALYRKYRPTNFNDVVGQDVIIKTLKNSLTNKKISHAYIFSGPRGSGKTSIAKIFAKLVNCENTDGTSMCGECVFCTQTTGQSMDIIEMDAASNNGVDEIRDINNKVNLVPSVGKYKIYIIDEVHMLTIGAFNALLKTIEEPPSHVIFILATTDPHKVPATILSRCQRFDFKKLSEECIIERLNYICSQENIQIEEQALSEIARLGDGSLRDAISILDQVIAYTNEKITLNDVHDVNGTLSQEEIYNLIDLIINNELGSVIEKIKHYNSKGKSIIKITEEIIIFLRDTLIFNKNHFPGNEFDYYVKIKDQINVNQILEIIQIFNQSLLDMKKFSDSKLILELSIIKIMNNISNKVEKSNLEEHKIKNERQNTIEVPEMVEQEIKNDRSFENLNKLKQFIDTRVGNALSNFSKKDTTDLKKSIEEIRNYLMDDYYGAYAEIILDGQLKAVGKNYIIFTYDTEHLANSFNENILNIEELLFKNFNKEYKVIAVNEEEWNTIKNNFNSKKVTFLFKEETIAIEEIYNKNEEDSLKKMFGDLVEYK